MEIQEVVLANETQAKNTDTDDFWDEVTQKNEETPETRNAFLITQNDLENFHRMQQSNQAIYVDGTLPCIKEIGYEILILRTYYWEPSRHIPIGIILIPDGILRPYDQRRHDYDH